MIIYKITNKINNKSYIGKAQNGFNRRYDGGKWWKYTENVLLLNSVNKYGVDNFTVEFLEKDVETPQKLRELEDYYMEKYNTIHPNGFNFLKSVHNGKRYGKIGKVKQMKRNIYKIKSPEGIIYDFNNMEKFCREHNLDRTTMLKVHRKEARQCFGWTRPEIKLEYREIMSPEGIVFSIREGKLREFCREHNLRHGSLILVWKRKMSHHNGWTLPDNPIEILKFKSPEDKIFEIKRHELPEFCIKNNIDANHMNAVWRKAVKSHNGWIRFDADRTLLRIKNKEDKNIMSPEGIIYTIKYGEIKEFAIIHNLCPHGLSSVLRNKRSQCYGWTLPNKPLRIRKIKSPEGTIYGIKYGELKIFCEKHNLNVNSIIRVWKGTQLNHYGWTKI